MTSASELFYTRRSRVGRPNPDPGIDSSIDRNYNRRYHNNRHDLDGCQHLRLSPHVRHSTSRSYSLSFDQGSSRFASINGVNAESVSSSNGQSLHSNERLPGAVLLARARLLERLRGVPVSANRRDGRGPPNPYDVREYLLCEDFREVDAGDWGSEISTGLSGGSSSFTDQTSQTEENNKKPPGLTQEAVDSLPLEVFRGEEVDGERESRDCSICLERFRDEDVLTRLVCGHRFHSTCLHPWVRSCGDCPYCRRTIL
ncbi:hypothetical protein ES319_D12G022100v1 [Gossypium barbadense]|uniref:RING-type domain-containing protein n=1 Tax=Gossypium barbadense TaxID=3634 RepID=A0A5J5NX91_GOSBA|nr:hypothetical protein ES319_D12G022100v1 [Gossypium barbadense]